jgi:two-component sensor histidine kinase
LTVRDNGIGLPEEFDWRQSPSLGLKLVWDLTKQLGGTMELVRDNGAAFQLRFAQRPHQEGG